MINRHVETIFCDDIRHEVGGKLSYIGVYSSVLYVQNLPAVLPKLCLSIKVVTHATEPFQSLKLIVFKDEDELERIELDPEQLASAIDALGEPEDPENGRHAATFLLVFSPLQLDSPCTLRVRVYTEADEVLRGVGLKIRQTGDISTPEE